MEEFKYYEANIPKKAYDDKLNSIKINIILVYSNSHRLEEPRVYQELKDYNFWENLYGTKWIEIAIYIVLAIR